MAWWESRLWKIRKWSTTMHKAEVGRGINDCAHRSFVGNSGEEGRMKDSAIKMQPCHFATKSQNFSLRSYKCRFLQWKLWMQWFCVFSGLPRRIVWQGEEYSHLAGSSWGHCQNIDLWLHPWELTLLSLTFSPLGRMFVCSRRGAVWPPSLRLAASLLLLATSKLSGTCRDISTLHLCPPCFRLRPLCSCIRMCIWAQQPRQSTYGNRAAPLSLVWSVSMPRMVHYSSAWCSYVDLPGLHLAAWHCATLFNSALTVQLQSFWHISFFEIGFFKQQNFIIKCQEHTLLATHFAHFLFSSPMSSF